MSSNIIQRAAQLPSANPGNLTSEGVINGADAALLVCLFPVGGSKLDRKPFTIRAAGRCTPGASSNLTVAIYYGVSTTIGSNTKIATTGALAAGTTATNWRLEAQCFYDSVSQRIQGLQKGFVNATAVAQAILTNAVTGVDPNTSGLGFSLTGLYGTGNAGHILFVDVFEIVAD